MILFETLINWSGTSWWTFLGKWDVMGHVSSIRHVTMDYNYLSFDPMLGFKKSKSLLLCIRVGKDVETLNWSWRCPDTPVSKRHVSKVSDYLSSDPMLGFKKSKSLLLCIRVGKDVETLNWSWRCPDTPVSKRHVSKVSGYLSFDPMLGFKKSKSLLLCIRDIYYIYFRLYCWENW